MRQLNGGVYTQKSNRRHKPVGHVFQGVLKPFLHRKKTRAQLSSATVQTQASSCVLVTYAGFDYYPDNANGGGGYFSYVMASNASLMSQVLAETTLGGKNNRSGDGQLAHSRLIVAARYNSLEKHYQFATFRHGVETNNQWRQTAEDPNAYDRPQDIVYLSDTKLIEWKNGVAQDPLSGQFGQVLAKLFKEQSGASPKDYYVKVNHGTIAYPVSVPSELFTYAYDANGNVISITGTNNTNLYWNDALDRLTDDQPANGPARQYAYDRNGNRTRMSENGTTALLDYQLNSNLLISDARGAVSHDAAGNRISDQNGDRTFGMCQAICRL